MLCTCGQHFKGNRGMMQHFRQGCPAAIVDLFREGKSSAELAKRFDKPVEKIDGIIRRAAIEQELKRKGS